MSECDRIRDQLEHAYRASAWHGPTVREALEPVDAGVAHRQPIAKAHTIAELVLHIAAWKAIVTRSLRHERVDVTPELDWPPPGDGEAGYRSALETLERAHQELIAAVSALDDAELDRIPGPGGKRTAYALLHGLAQHDTYHAGQIVLLRRAAERQE